MASSMLTGDRRWGQTRKSGMTVLGKVPKPINLPSQRLENHGLDPNVEIVPKGTLSWGSRPSLATANAWGSSSLLSPNTDGSTASPSCLSGRPSSGGSFTRPSTAASDRSQQAVSNAWDSNSRPSSASGIFQSNQTSGTLTRPRSAETRPGSSLFSCFKEPVAENSAWGTTRIAEKLVSASNPNSFTLSSGDFPTLGSDKNAKSNVVQRGHSSQGRPVSASGRVAAQKETTEPAPTGNQTVVHLEKGNVNTWRRDNSPCTTVSPSSGNWHRDELQTQTYQDANVHSQQFDSWLGPPMQSPPDVWYRGGPSSGVYRPGVPPGSYTHESYIYYPQLPARPLSNSQASPSHGAAAGGYGPMNGVPYRPHTPDSFMVPNHPIGPMRPEVYPRQVHYESYYGPPPKLGNSDEQDGPALRMTPCSRLPNQHLDHNSNMESGKFYAVPCSYAPSVPSEQTEDGHPQERNGPPYKVLLKQHNGCKDDDPDEKKDQSVTDGLGQFESGASRPGQKNGGKDDPSKMEVDGVASQHAKSLEIHSSVSTVHKNVTISTKSETVDDHCANTASKGEDLQRYSVKRGSTLIEKIESLNNKARLADGRAGVPASVGEEKNKQFKNLDIKADPTKVPSNASIILPEKSSANKVPSDGDMESKTDTGDTKIQLRASEEHTFAVALDPSDVGLAAQSTHRRVHSKQNRADYHAKSRFNSQDAEEWRKISPGRNSSAIDSVENQPELRVQDCQTCQDAPEKKELNHMTVGDEKYVVSSMDPSDYKAQHAKMKEIARQRAKQLQMEEEERIREQKARALAKLEELNRRTLTESSNQTLHSLTVETQTGLDARERPDSKTKTRAAEIPNLISGSSIVVAQRADKADTLGVRAVLQTSEGFSMLEESADSSPKAVSVSITHNDQPMLLSQDVIKREGKTDGKVHHSSFSKQNRVSHKKQDDSSEEKHLLEDISIGVMVGSIIVGSKSLGESAPPGNLTCDGIPSDNKEVDEPLVHHKKRNNRTTRNKNRLDEASSSTILQQAQKVPENFKIESCKPQSSESVVQDNPVQREASNETVQAEKSSDIGTVSPNQGPFQGTTGAQDKAAVHWRPQPPRRVTRNPQATKSADKFHGTEAVVWAPVKSTNKKVPSEEVQKVTSKSNPDSSSKNGSDIEQSLKYKRAEMERYVPKPIAKELSQQENSQQPFSPSQSHAASTLKGELCSLGVTDSGLDHSATVKMDAPTSTRNGENRKPNKHGRAHTSWQRRGLPESSSPLPNLPEGSASFDSNKDSENASRLDSQKEKTKVTDDGWNDDRNCLMQCEPTAAPSVEKDHAKMNRGRRQPFKGHKFVRDSCSSRDNWEPGHARTDKPVSPMEADESAGRKNMRNENQSASDHPKSQWQPKSQAFSASNHCPETKATGVQRVASQGNRFDKESLLSGDGNNNQPIEGKSVSTAVTVAGEVRNARQHEIRRERRVREESFIRQSPAANQDSTTVPEPALQNAVSQNEPVPSGSRRNGQRNGWLARGHETSFGGHGGLVGQDTGKQNPPANVDRHKQYQRTGYYDKQIDSFQHNSAVGEEVQSVSKSMGKYRERSHNHPKRGGHYYSQSRTRDAYGNGE